MSNLVRSISSDGSVLACCINSLNIVKEIKNIHNCCDSITAVLGKLSTAVSLMGSMLKGDNDSITVRIDGGDIVGHIISVADSRGNVKSYCTKKEIKDKYDSNGNIDINDIISKNGTLTVMKDIGFKQPQIGQISIYSGGIAEDITYYYATSEQIPTVCGLGLLINNGKIISSGGYLIQLLPFADNSCIDIIEKNIKNVGSVSKLFMGDLTCEEISFKLLENLSPNVIDHMDAEYICKCSKDKVEKAILSLGKDQVNELIKLDNKIEINCDFCNKKYVFTKNDINF